MLARRRSLSAEERRAASLWAQQSLLATPEYGMAQTVALYAAIHGEVETSLLFERALEDRKEVLFPAVCGEDLHFIRVTTSEGLQRGEFGIPEPCLTGERVPPEQADIILVPGVAFDLLGYRIGYGKGFYDRALHHVERQGKLVGFCYDFQLVEKLVGEPHDVVLDLIVTDQRVVRPHGYQ